MVLKLDVSLRPVHEQYIVKTQRSHSRDDLCHDTLAITYLE